jgi:hypothetical protein
MTTSTPTNTSKSRPWLWLVAAFFVMIAFWTVMLTICFRNQPVNIEVPVGHAAAD